MEINAKSTGRKLLLELSGELDHQGAAQAIWELELALDAALPLHLALDLSGVTFMGTAADADPGREPSCLPGAPAGPAGPGRGGHRPCRHHPMRGEAV